MSSYILIGLGALVGLAMLASLLNHGIKVAQNRRWPSLRRPRVDPVVDDLTSMLNPHALTLEHGLILDGLITSDAVVEIHRRECVHCRSHAVQREVRREAITTAAAALESPGVLGAYRDTLPALKVDGWVTHHGLGQCHKIAGQCPLCAVGVPHDLVEAGAWLAKRQGQPDPRLKTSRRREPGVFGALLEAKRAANGVDPRGITHTNYATVEDYVDTHGLDAHALSALGPGALSVEISDGSEFIPDDGGVENLTPRTMGTFRHVR